MKTQFEEVNEAIRAGEEALSLIESVEANLRSAKGWGIVDLFSKGGFLTSIIKHSKLSEAEDAMNELRYAINKFNSEIKDIHISENVGSISMGTGMQLADWFFDGILVDAFTLAHISESQEKLYELKSQVIEALNRLNYLKNTIEENS